MLPVVQSNGETGSERRSSRTTPKRNSTDIVLLGVSDDVFEEGFDVVERGGSPGFGSESIVGREDVESSFGEVAVESKVDGGNSSDVSTSVYTEHLFPRTQSAQVERSKLEKTRTTGRGDCALTGLTLKTLSLSFP